MMMMIVMTVMMGIAAAVLLVLQLLLARLLQLGGCEPTAFQQTKPASAVAAPSIAPHGDARCECPAAPAHPEGTYKPRA
jgi:hypothetical protein